MATNGANGNGSGGDDVIYIGMEELGLMRDLVKSNQDLAISVARLTERIEPFADYREDIDGLAERCRRLEVWQASVNATAGAAKFGWVQALAVAGFLFGLITWLVTH